MHKQVESEIRYLNDIGLGHKNCADTICALVAVMNQCFQCYATSGRIHAMHMVRHLAAIAQIYFDKNRFAVNVRPQGRRGSFGQWLFAMDGQIDGARRAMREGSEGDAKSYLMNLLGACAGCADEFGMEGRQGYETES